jgi:4-hydroxythreonine-4-phosphate dehydrogenase
MLNVKNYSKPRIGITIGDFNGVGPELIMKVMSDIRVLKLCTPVIYGSAKIFLKYKKLFNNDSFNFQQVANNSPIAEKRVNVINCWEDTYEIFPGKVREEAGKCAYLALARSTEDLKSGLIDAVVTAPINKANIQSPNFPYPGHTEYYAAAFGKEDNLMLLVSNELRIGTVTGHIPVQKVSAALTKEKVIAKALILLESLKHDFGIRKPKIALLGLNPHAGEEGLLGKEEIDVIAPAIQQLKKRGNLFFGPFSADGFFGSAQYRKYDGVLAMYHDQGLIPFKLMAFEDGVNFTAGLPIVRTSPDHGTAYGLAGKNTASDDSLRAAIFMACDIVRNRNLFKGIEQSESTEPEQVQAVQETENQVFI